MQYKRNTSHNVAAGPLSVLSAGLSPFTTFYPPIPPYDSCWCFLLLRQRLNSGGMATRKEADMLQEKECAQDVAASQARKGSSRTAAHSIAANAITAILTAFLLITAAGFVIDAWLALMKFFVVICAGNPFGWSL